MTRQEQREEFESYFIWTEDAIKHFHAAFLAHYHILNTTINGALKLMDENMPRLAYFLYTEYLYSVYTEICLTTECLFKAIMESNGFDQKTIMSKKHNLLALLNEVSSIKDEKAKAICGIMEKHRVFLEQLSKDNVFVNARYMESDPAKLQENLESLWSLLSDIDKIAFEFFDSGKLISIVYPDSMVD